MGLIVGLNMFNSMIGTLTAQIEKSGWPVDTLAALSRGGFPVAAALADALDIGASDMFGLPARRTDDNTDYVLGNLVTLGDLSGRHVLVVDDAVDRGLLVRNATAAITDHGAQARTCALIATRRTTKPDYVAHFANPLPKFYWQV